MILQQDMKSGNNIMPMLSKYLLLLLALYENLLIIIIGKNSSRVPFQIGVNNTELIMIYGTNYLLWLQGFEL